MKILFKDKLGNKIVEESSGAVGLTNAKGGYCSKKELKGYIKEQQLGDRLKFEGERLLINRRYFD